MYQGRWFLIDIDVFFQYYNKMQCIEDIVRIWITAKKLTVLAYRYQYQIYQLVFTTPSPGLVRVSTGDELSME